MERAGSSDATSPSRWVGLEHCRRSNQNAEEEAGEQLHQGRFARVDMSLNAAQNNKQADREPH